jgi:hypothetical protein
MLLGGVTGEFNHWVLFEDSILPVEFLCGCLWFHSVLLLLLNFVGSLWITFSDTPSARWNGLSGIYITLNTWLLQRILIEEPYCLTDSCWTGIHNLLARCFHIGSDMTWAQLKSDLPFSRLNFRWFPCAPWAFLRIFLLDPELRLAMI